MSQRIHSEPRRPEREWSRVRLADSAAGHAGQRLVAQEEPATLEDLKNALRSALSVHLQEDVDDNPNLPLAERVTRLSLSLGCGFALALLPGDED